MKINKLYRWERGWEDYEDAFPSLHSFDVLRETPCGVIIKYKDNTKSNKKEERWVSLNNKKRFAYPTPEEAFVNFSKRQEKCHRILMGQILRCEAYMKIKKCPKY